VPPVSAATAPGWQAVGGGAGGADGAGATAGATDDPLALLLAGQFPDPDGGAPLGTAIRAIVVADDLIDRAIAGLDALDLPRRAVALMDVDTAVAMGDRVAQALRARGPLQVIGLGRRPHADDDTIARVDGAAEAGVELVVSVGSGTLTDLGKLLAFRRGLPHAAFATAPSMNGYTSVSASITSGGLKRSVRVAAPTAVFLDTRVLAAAPARLVRAGLGDSLARSTAQTDWLLAHLLLGRPYRTAPFALLAADEAAVLSEPAALLAGDRGAARHLARLLALSGCGMTICGGSYPASQGEHLLSHYLESRTSAVTPTGDTPLHGEQIGVTTLTMARLQRELLDRAAAPVLAPSQLDEDAVVRHFGRAQGASCWRELAPKLCDAAGAAERGARLAAIWDDLAARVAAIAIPPERLRAILAAVGAPTTACELGWPAAHHDDALRWARALRDRYTFLDLAADAGLPPHRA
jgi:glycerol-1-phosphate dehydrogenase [NAD(P)+]